MPTARFQVLSLLELGVSYGGMLVNLLVIHHYLLAKCQGGFLS